MAKVIRSCWVYKPLHRYRVLPRPKASGYHEFDYEKAGATAASFPDKLEREERPKLWLAWVYVPDLQGQKYWIRDQIRFLFGDDWKPGEMHVFKNVASVNDQLWRVKHLIELRPVTFPHGEPTAKDIPYCRLRPDGRCEVDKTLGEEGKKHDDQGVVIPDELSDDERWRKTRFTQTHVARNTMTRWHAMQSPNEDDVWSDPNVSRL